MSQYGMNMPGGNMRRGPSLNVYTGLLFLAVVAMAAASVFVWNGATKIGLKGDAFGIQPSPSNGKSAIDLGN